MNDIVEWLDSEEGKQFIKEFFDKVDARNAEQKKFFETPEFFQIIERIRDALTTDGRIAFDEYDEESDAIFAVKYSEFMRVINTLYLSCPLIIETDTEFPTKSVVYSGIKFIAVDGQGTALSAKLVTN